jgi:hypothetical protein
MDGTRDQPGDRYVQFKIVQYHSRSDIGDRLRQRHEIPRPSNVVPKPRLRRCKEQGETIMPCQGLRVEITSRLIRDHLLRGPPINVRKDMGNRRRPIQSLHHLRSESHGETTGPTVVDHADALGRMLIFRCDRSVHTPVGESSRLSCGKSRAYRLEAIGAISSGCRLRAVQYFKCVESRRPRSIASRQDGSITGV